MNMKMTVRRKLLAGFGLVCVLIVWLVGLFLLRILLRNFQTERYIYRCH